MKKFAFVSDAAEKEYKEMPEHIQDEFGKDLRKIQFGQTPVLPINYLDSLGQGVIELKKNGSPANAIKLRIYKGDTFAPTDYLLSPSP